MLIAQVCYEDVEESWRPELEAGRERSSHIRFKTFILLFVSVKLLSTVPNRETEAETRAGRGHIIK